jgi:hypothetical protein
MKLRNNLVNALFYEHMEICNYDPVLIQTWALLRYQIYIVVDDQVSNPIKMIYRNNK